MFGFLTIFVMTSPSYTSALKLGRDPTKCLRAKSDDEVSAVQEIPAIFPGFFPLMLGEHYFYRPPAISTAPPWRDKGPPLILAQLPPRVAAACSGHPAIFSGGITN